MVARRGLHRRQRRRPRQALIRSHEHAARPGSRDDRGDRSSHGGRAAQAAGAPKTERHRARRSRQPGGAWSQPAEILHLSRSRRGSRPARLPFYRAWPGAWRHDRRAAPRAVSPSPRTSSTSFIRASPSISMQPVLCCPIRSSAIASSARSCRSRARRSREALHRFLTVRAIAPYKFPDKLVVVKEIPRDAGGRVLREEILTQV
jgi:hypothetical protein